MDKTIDEIICPNEGEIYLENDALKVDIMDVEMDVMKCEFTNGDSVMIDTSEYSYITLSSCDLERLMSFISLAENKYEEMNNE